MQQLNLIDDFTHDGYFKKKNYHICGSENLKLNGENVYYTIMPSIQNNKVLIRFLASKRILGLRL